MLPPVLLAARMSDIWYAIPLIIAVSLVYAGTRYEALDEILHRALRVGIAITGVLAAIFITLEWISRPL